MPGMAALAMGAAPVLGGALLGAAVGQFKGPDLRDGSKQDLELLTEQTCWESALPGFPIGLDLARNQLNS